MKPFTIIAAVVCGIYLLLEWTEGKTCYYTTTIDENGAAKWNRDKGDCDVIKFGGVKTTAAPKSFTDKGISPTTDDILTSSTAQTSEDIPSTEAVGSTNNPPAYSSGKGISPTTEDSLTSSTAQTLVDISSTEAVGSTNNQPGKGIATTNEDILTSSTAQTSEDTPSTEAVGSTNNPPGIAATTEDILTSSTAQTSEDIPSTQDVGSTNNPPGTSIPTCPKNMIYGTCRCQATCEDPNGQSGCNSDCLSPEGCTCPDGFLMNGSDCISASECVCFVAEADLFLTNGEASVNDNCTQKCSCNNNQLNCEDYSCSTNAMCDVKNELRKCYCNAGFEGDGETCESLYTDCQDVYDAGHTQDGVYTIMPTGWPGLPFNVSCKMENGGGWTVFQRRTDGSTSFYQNWAAYKEGFGDSRNLWLGNDKLHYLTNQRNYKLRFDITTSSGSAEYAEYPQFQIESESNNYRMKKLADRSSGNTGNHFYHNKGKQFSTHDRNNDGCGDFNCAEKHRSGWWHSDTLCTRCVSTSQSYCNHFQYSSSCKSVCTTENLNGVYNGVNGEMIFSSFPFNSYCNVQYVEMKIRPSS